MEELRVVIPEEDYSLIEWRQDDLPGVGCINRALLSFEPKIVFRWHLSVWIELTDLVDNGMPSQVQREVVDPFGNELDHLFKGQSIDKPNALFLGRLTWNASRELIYRVYDPKPVDGALQAIIQSGSHPCAFDFRMEDDPEWILAQWHLNATQPQK